MKFDTTNAEETAGRCASGAQDPRVRIVIALMRQHYGRALTLARLADAVHLSVWHLCHLFKMETGKPPAQFLKSIRMEEARRLLESTLLSVKEVVNKVGMNDQSHFVKDFKKIYGETPTKYRGGARAQTPVSEQARRNED